MPRRPRIALLSCLVFAALKVAGCGGGSGPSDPPPKPVGFVLLPKTALMDAGQTIDFAVVNDSSSSGVSWKLTGPGTLTNLTSSSVTYTPPSSVASTGAQATITATAVVNAGVSHSATVDVRPQPTFTTTTLPDGNAGAEYDASIPIVGGRGFFNFAVTGGALPPGLDIRQPPYDIFGVPKLPAQKYTFTIAATDSTDAGDFIASANLSINILPPLPLSITTMPPLPAFGVNIASSARINATGGLRPYTFMLASGSNPLPSGLALTTDTANGLFISGKPTTQGTTNDIIIQVADSQTPAVVSPPVTYSVTVNPSTNFVGTQLPGDVWRVTISHSDTNDGIFTANDQGTNGLPGTTTKAFSRDFLTLNAGSRKYFDEDGLITNPNGHGDPGFGPRYSHAVELPDQILLMQPADETQVGHQVIAAVPPTCPQLAATFPATATYNFISLPTNMFATSENPSYGTLSLTQSASNTFSLTFSTFQNDGTSIPSTTITGVVCDSNLQVLSFTGPSGSSVIVSISAAGGLVIDNGTGIPALGVRQPPTDQLSTAILSGQYLGLEYDPTATSGTGASGVVGFGPGSGTYITGGLINDQDAFNAHGTEIGLTLGAHQTSPGLFPGGNVTVVTNGLFNGTHSNFNAVVGQLNGKFVLFGVSAETPFATPYVLLLIQQ